VPAAGAAAAVVVDGAAFGAWPVVRRDSPTDERPPLGNELEASELEPNELDVPEE